MPRFTAAGRGVTNLPTTVAGPCVIGSANAQLHIREVGVFNTTATAVAVGLMRGSTAVGVGVGAVTVSKWNKDAVGTNSTAFTSNTGGTSPTSDGVFGRAALGAAIGSGMVWTFGEEGLIVPNLTTASFHIVCPTGTAQFLDFYIVWDE